MSVPTGFPAPASNMTAAGFIDAASDVVAADIMVAVGDENGGVADDMFTVASHGLATGDYVFLLHKIAVGAVTGKVGTRFRVKVTNANVFQLTDTAGTVIVNTADGASIVFLKAIHSTPTAMVQTVIIPRLIVADGDFVGGAAADMFAPRLDTGYHALQDTDTLKLLYKAAAGVLTGIAVDTTVFAKGLTTALFVTSATSGGANIANSADGLAIFLKTS